MDTYDSPENIVRKRRPDVPVVCYRPVALESAVSWFSARMPGRILYAVKANPSPYVLSGLSAAGVNSFDVASLTEIKLVRDHCPGAFLAFMHPVKSRSAITQAYFDHNVRHFAFDSTQELSKIAAATSKARDLGLILRLAVPNASSALSLAGKFGALPDKAASLLKAARKMSDHIGISFHVGSQAMDPRAFVTALAVVGDVLKTLPENMVDMIDIGGGFPSIYPGMEPPALDAYAAAVEEGLAALPHAGQYAIWCEPGRALVAESASLLVRVNLRKDDILYINDGTFGSLFDAGPSLAFRFPVRLVRPGSKKTDQPLKEFRFYGPTCTSEDYMPGPFVLPDDMREGDYIEIGQMGAYGSVMRTDFNGFFTHETAAVKTPPLLSLYEQTSITENTKQKETLS